ncbi:MAG: CAP domain-containing protein [Lachnospiraceae bacterium]|nr:CAP domain-containing protein [Lachnospiraceae bacterium]
MPSVTEKEVCTEKTDTRTAQDTYTDTTNDTAQDTYTDTTNDTAQDPCTDTATSTAQETYTEVDTDISCTSCPVALIEQVNSYRAANGLGILSHSSELDYAAAVRCRELIANMSHTRPDGRSCSTVYTDLGISASVWGENLAAGYDSSAEVAADWMASPTHMANILDESFTRCGVAYLSCNSGYGSYWVILFSD